MSQPECFEELSYGQRDWLFNHLAKEQAEKEFPNYKKNYGQYILYLVPGLFIAMTVSTWNIYIGGLYAFIAYIAMNDKESPDKVISESTKQYKYDTRHIVEINYQFNRVINLENIYTALKTNQPPKRSMYDLFYDIAREYFSKIYILMESLDYKVHISIFLLPTFLGFLLLLTHFSTELEINNLNIGLALLRIPIATLIIKYIYSIILSRESSKVPEYHAKYQYSREPNSRYIAIYCGKDSPDLHNIYNQYCTTRVENDKEVVRVQNRILELLDGRSQGF